jgi:hypothetical protein
MKLPWYDTAIILFTVIFLFMAVLNYSTLTNIGKDANIAKNVTTNSFDGTNQFITLNLIFKVKANSNKTQKFTFPKNFCLYNMYVTPINNLVGTTGTLNATMTENENTYLDNFNVFTGPKPGLQTSKNINLTDFLNVNSSCHIKNGSPKLTLISTYENNLDISVSITLSTISTFYNFTP